MRRPANLLAWLLLALAALFCASSLNAQSSDTYVAQCASQPSCILASGVSWANGNQVWRFTAWQQNESVRIWIRNNNPTNGHSSQTVQLFITDDATAPGLLSAADRWVQAVVIDNSITNAKCTQLAANAPTATPGANGKGTCYSVGMYAVQIAVRITGAAAQAGTSDTFDIGVVQQASTYPGGPQPGNDESAGGSTSAVNITQIAGTATSINTTQGLPTTAATTSRNTSIVPSTSSAVESNHVYVVGVGKLYDLSITTGATAGLLMIFDAASAPVDGAVVPTRCIQVAANSTTALSFAIPDSYVTGITAVFSTGTNCFSKTASATATFTGRVQ